MINIEELLRRRLTDNDAAPLVADAIAKRKPFSFVRMNDGEAAILGFGHEHNHEEPLFFYNHWWGDSSFQEDYTLWLQEELINSAEQANILVFFDSIDKKPYKFGRTGKMLRERADLSNVDHFVTPEAHLNWHQDEKFVDMFSSVGEVTIIACYDLSSRLQEQFNFSKVNLIRIPGHSKYTPAHEIYSSHPKETFAEIVSTLKEQAENKIYFIGAGVLGKIYARIIKEHGGIALDLGSVFDNWVGNKKRSSVKKYRIGF